MGPPDTLLPLIREANELVSIFVASINTAKSKLALHYPKNSF
jgi:hypothetical protein